MEELLDTWEPKGVGVGGGCASSHTECGKLMYNMVSIFSISHLVDT